MSVVSLFHWRGRRSRERDGVTAQQAREVLRAYHVRRLLVDEITARTGLPRIVVQDVIRGAVWPGLAPRWRFWAAA